jgi:hypothetical protein
MSSIPGRTECRSGKKVSFCAASVMVMKRGSENELFYSGFEVDLRKLLRYGVGGLF